MDSRIVLNDCYKVFKHDQDKVRSPEQTVRWVNQRLARLDMNILSETKRIDTGRLDIPVYISFCGEDATRLTGTKKQMGKGASPEQALASAVMELMERFSFFAFIREGRFPLRAQHGGEDAVAADTLKRSVHDRNTPIDRCRELLLDFPLRCTVARNLTRERDQWVPIDWFYLINEYNGPAAGNTLEEAILQGLCEVVERHVGSIVSYEKSLTPLIDLDTVTDPAARELIDKFQHQGIELFVRDLSLDTGIPTVGVLAYDPATFPEKSEIVFTAGTTTDPQKSLCRALTEVAQLAGDFESRTTYRPTLPKYHSLDQAHYLMQDGPRVAISALPDLAHDNLRVEIRRCVEALERIELEVLCVNVTHPRLQVPAVYMIVPGAHFLDHTRNTDFAQHAARTLLHGLPPGQAQPHMDRLQQWFGPRYDLTFFHAHTLELQGQTEAALAAFREALQQQPEVREIASIHVHIASCLKELGRYREALDALEHAASYNDQLKEIHNLRGFCYYQLRRHNESIAAFERAIELDPGSAIDYANIGSNLRELGHKREAVHLYKMALELDPDIDFARDNLNRLQRELDGDTCPR